MSVKISVCIATLGWLALLGSCVAQSEDGILSCSWGKTLCAWRSPPENKYVWDRTHAARSYGKEVRSSPTSADDSFLWATGGDVQALSHNSLVVLQSVEFYNPAPGILSFFHVAQSPSTPGLYVNVTLNGITRTVKKFQGFQHHWKQRTVDIDGPGRVVVTIAAAPVGHGIDEMEYSRDAGIAVFREFVIPFHRPAVQDGEVSCSFHHDLCGWSTYPGLSGHWQRTASTAHLPRGFINSSSNHWEDAWFLSVNEPEHHGEDTQAAIVTRTIFQSAPSWLNFWWAKFEPVHAESAIFVKVVTETTTESVYYSKLPAHFWVNQNVTIPFTGRLRIIIGFRLTTEASHGALDEIQFSGDLTSDYISTTEEPGSGDDSQEFLF